MNGIDLIELLNLEFQRRTDKNAKYSLRAFARDLGVTAGSLSHIMKRKRPTNKEFREKIAEALNLSQEQKSYLESHADDVMKFSQKEIDMFLYLSEWYYDAIIELMRTKGFESNLEFISDRLGINPTQAETAINRLIQMGTIKKMPNKTWLGTPENILIYGGDQTTFALQKLQRQLLEKAIQALEEVPKAQREQASMVMAINKKDLPEVRTKIKDFHQDICKYLQRPHRETDEVYQLITTCFPLTKI